MFKYRDLSPEDQANIGKAYERLDVAQYLVDEFGPDSALSAVLGACRKYFDQAEANRLEVE